MAELLHERAGEWRERRNVVGDDGPWRATDSRHVEPDHLDLGPAAQAGRRPPARNATRAGFPARVAFRESVWAAMPIDRPARLCRHHGVELSLAIDGRWWALVWAAAAASHQRRCSTPWDGRRPERDVVRAFRSLLGRRRFFGVSTSSGSCRCCGTRWTARRTSPRSSACRCARPSSCSSP